MSPESCDSSSSKESACGEAASLPLAQLHVVEGVGAQRPALEESGICMSTSLPGMVQRLWIFY